MRDCSHGSFLGGINTNRRRTRNMRKILSVESCVLRSNKSCRVCGHLDASLCSRSPSTERATGRAPGLQLEAQAPGTPGPLPWAPGSMSGPH